MFLLAQVKPQHYSIFSSKTEQCTFNMEKVLLYWSVDQYNNAQKVQKRCRSCRQERRLPCCQDGRKGLILCQPSYALQLCSFLRHTATLIQFLWVNLIPGSQVNLMFVYFVRSRNFLLTTWHSSAKPLNFSSNKMTSDWYMFFSAINPQMVSCFFFTSTFKDLK